MLLFFINTFNIKLKNYFNSVIEWINSLFDYTDKEVRGLPWGEYYKKYHNNAYNKDEITKKVNELMSDPYVNNKKGIFEYVLSNCSKPELLNIRIFDNNTKRTAYEIQTQNAKIKGISNCPLCAISNNSNKTRIYKFSEMDADHVSAWSKGGLTNISNCEMLCTTHNKAKGNK